MSARITLVHVSASIFSLMFHLLCQHTQHRQALATEEVHLRLLDAHNKIQQTITRLAPDGESDDDAFMLFRGQSLQQHVITASATKKRQNKIQKTSARLAADGESDDDAFMQLSWQSRQHVREASAAMAKGAAPGKTPTAEPGRNCASHDNSDNEGSDDDRDDPEDGADTPLSWRRKATAIYTAPSNERVENLALYGVSQPRMPVMEQLMELCVWRLGILFAMVPEVMVAAGKGLAHLDKGMANKGGLRIVRSFMRNQAGKFVDSGLEKHAPLLFALVKILMEEHDFDQVTLQKMLTRLMHCDPHCRHAKPEHDEQECHVLLTVNGDHFSE
jgi:hypothetical protein